MAQVDFDLTTSMGDTHISITLGDEDVIDAYEDAFYGYCMVCRDYTVAGDEKLCCNCLETEIKTHFKVHDCVEEVVADLGIGGKDE